MTDKVNFKDALDKAKEETRLSIHSFHRYYGKLIPAIPRAAISEFTTEDDLVFDLFAGSGTTAVETLWLNRRFAGVEINPLSVMIARVKTAKYDLNILAQAKMRLIELIEKDNAPITELEKPFCVNRDHWFKDFVQDDLVRVARNIPFAIDFIEESERQKYRDFFFVTLSAIVKQVSNADTMHVFPGISKRMRKLEQEGKIRIHVCKTFEQALKKRIFAVEQFHSKGGAEIIEGDSSKIDLATYKNKVDLIVTNPPYISSVRYAETLKLELYWIGICRSASEYNDLARSMIGNDRIKSSEHKEKFYTQYECVNRYIDMLFEIDTKQAKVVYDYFSMMEKVIINAAALLKSGKKLVMKISDSKIRKIAVPTGKLLTEIAQKHGFSLCEIFVDKIDSTSRSLTTARNTYSDIIVEDNIIIWERNHE